MRHELRNLVFSVFISIVLIRFWIEIVTTTVFKNSEIIASVNNNKIGYHHWQLGIMIMIISAILKVLMPKINKPMGYVFGFGLALFLDQYTYVLTVLGIKLPFVYRSLADYLFIVGFLVILVIYWLCLKKD